MNDSLLLFGLIHTSLLEIISFLLAIVMVLLNIRQSPWAWLFAIASAGLYVVVFYGAKIYGDMVLQFVFIAVSLWGAYQWLFGGRDHQGVNVTQLSGNGWYLVAAVWLVAYAIIAMLLHTFTDSDVTHIDAFLTAGSLVAQFLLTRKTLENWHMWILIDGLYIGLYLHKHLYLTAVLYGLFALLAVLGLRAWKRSLPARVVLS
ncbi:nicotinamide riboside transporter PnuC [Methylobacillus gramineus]|uniref:nicotinamide riboside transporter PnuC n=1 Tax=Methylobacillus gramineus TaxID=755169 RepID=UPI001CFF6489|nr:nicotinamide riboside transporter PnuC [Methylobacillus gramineus]MCB5183746.1 nicotinamide riboside transporter PnuC [Methylobacillus gramineus]